MFFGSLRGLPKASAPTDASTSAGAVLVNLGSQQMDKSNHITRRAALVGAAVSSVALAVPAAAAVKPATIEALAEKFRADASALDPRIDDCWLGYDELATGPREMRVMSIYLGRSGTPFVRPVAAPVEAPPSIADLFRQWREIRDTSHRATGADFDALHGQYERLQRRITAMVPTNAREAAMQLVTETDDGESDFRDAFFRRVRKLAIGG